MSWRRAFVAVLVLLPVIGLLAFGMTRDPRVIPSPLPGRAAPDFALDVMPLDVVPVGDTDSAATIQLADLRGNVVVLNFWASWCLACRDEHAPLSQVAREYRGQPVRFYGVVYNDSQENAKRWIRRMGGQSYPALVDPGARTAIEYGLYGVPETFFIAPDGTVSRKVTGPVTAAVLREEIGKLLQAEAGREVPAGSDDA